MKSEKGNNKHQNVYQDKYCHRKHGSDLLFINFNQRIVKEKGYELAKQYPDQYLEPTKENLDFFKKEGIRFELDKIKEDYCSANGHTLIRIPYWLYRHSTYKDILNQTFFGQINDLT